MKQSLEKKAIIKQQAIFQLIIKNGKKHQGKYLNITSLPCEKTMVGFTVNKKCGCAVKRNYVKRVLKDLYRKNKIYFANSQIVMHGKFCEKIAFGSLIEDLLKIVNEISD